MTFHQSTIATSPSDRHLTASAVIFNNDGDVLLVHHRKSGFWQFPGGHVDPNEAPHETALREVQEETGIVATYTSAIPCELPGMTNLPRPLVVAEIPAGAWEANGEWPAEPAHHHIDFLYVAWAITTAIKPQEDEVAGARWVSRTDIRRGVVNARAEVPQVMGMARNEVPAFRLTR